MIVGLGNPGIRYALNRHNVGFILLDHYAERHHLGFSRRRFDALIAEGDVQGQQRVLLCKPQSYMNESGIPVGKLASFYRVPSHDIIIVYDDLDLPLGRLRLRPQGSAGGHHGMESIIGALGHSNFARLRIGIGRPSTREDIGHVLGNFSDQEQTELDPVWTRAMDALDVWLTEGIERAMNLYNG
ncbi:MAG: aminoacyl-tRNA hydrolase [Anaerolineae bacterium]